MSPTAASAPATPAVLLLLFNRPETTRAVFETIRRARPARLYLAADGPRPGHPTDAATCAAARAEVARVDWPCQVHHLFQTRNLNCGLGPATAISWFFGHEEEGIILEDDCVAVPDFFRFCAELLARYRYDGRVLHIGGNNFGSEAQRPGAESYYFSGQVHSWGWATWRRAWHLYDFAMPRLEALHTQGRLRAHYGSWLEARYWGRQFAALRRAPALPPDVWDYQWHFTVAAQGGLTIVPAVNLVGNIGFGAHATHTHDAADHFAAAPAAALPMPLCHPAAVQRNWPRDRRRFREFVAGRVTAKIRRVLRHLLARRAVVPPAAVAQPPRPAPTQVEAALP